MPTPIEELTAREMEEGRRRVAPPEAVAVAPGSEGGGPAPLAVPTQTVPVVSPTTPTDSFLEHLEEEIKDRIRRK